MEKLHENFDDFVNEAKSSYKMKKMDGKNTVIHYYDPVNFSHSELSDVITDLKSKLKFVSNKDIKLLEEIAALDQGLGNHSAGEPVELFVIEFKKSKYYIIQLTYDSSYTPFVKSSIDKDFDENHITNIIRDYKDGDTIQGITITNDQIEMLSDDHTKWLNDIPA